MQKKRYITFFLMFISMVMLVVPVIPHHHHNNGLICMKNDIAPDCCGQQHNSDNEHCCCDTGCVTTHFFQQTPSSDNGWTLRIFHWLSHYSPNPFSDYWSSPKKAGKDRTAYTRSHFMARISHVPQDFAHLRVFLLYRKVCNFIAGFYL